jgi:carboxypeptidase D
MNPTLFENIPIVRVIETYPQLINYDTQMYDYLCDQNHVCNFDLNLTYPQTSGEAPVHAHQEGNPRPPAAAVSVYAAPRAERRRRLFAGAARALARFPGGGATPLAGGARAATEGVDAGYV